MKRVNVFALGSVLSVVLGSAAAAAAGNSGNTNSTSGTETEGQEVVGIESVVVTAQRREELARNVPFSITTADAVQLEKTGVTNMMDLQKVVPGLVMTGDGAWSMPSLRGVSTTVSGPTNDSPIAVYVDGIYQPNQLGGFFDLPNIERVEVDKGPQGTLFGRNATGGAIQIITAAPSFTPSWSVEATAGVFPGAGSSHVASDLGVKGFLTGPLTDDLAGSISVHLNNTSGYLNDIVRHDSYGQMRDFGGRAKLQYNVSDDLSFVLTGFYNDRDDDHAGSAVALDGISVATLWPGSIVTSEPWEITADQRPYVKTKTWGISLRGDLDSDIGTFTSLTSYYDVRVDADINTDLAYASLDFWQMGPGVDFKLPNYYERSFSQEVYLSSHKWGPFSFVSGANMYLSTGFQPGVINDFRQAAPLPALLGTGPIFQFSALIHATAYAAYTELYYDVTNSLHIIGGVRYSYENKKGDGGYTCCDPSVLPRYADKTWTNPIYRASIRYDVGSASNIYFTFSQGFKSGIVPYSDFSGQTANPEKINSFELGYKGTGENWDMSLSGFLYKYKDMQVQTFDRIVSAVTNAASSTIAGIDFDSTYQFSDAFDVHLAATWLPVARFDNYDNAIAYNFPLTANPGLTQYIVSMNGVDLIKTPKFTSTLTATYKARLNQGALTSSVSLYGSSKFYNDIAGIMPTDAYVTLAGQVTYRPDDSEFEYSIWGRNLTNVAFVASAIPGAPTPYVMYGAPLEIGVSLRYMH